MTKATERHNNKTNPVNRGREGQNKREREKNPHNPSPQHTFYDYLKLALIIIAVVALGLLAINQYLSFQYKIYLLSDPCDMCMELNPKHEIVTRVEFQTPVGIEEENKIKRINDFNLSSVIISP